MKLFPIFAVALCFSATIAQAEGCKRNKFTGTCSSITPAEHEAAMRRHYCELGYGCVPYGYSSAPAPVAKPNRR